MMRTHRQQNSANQPGFTLVELVLVMVITGVLAAIAMPRFAQASANQRLEAAADRVVADLKLASTRARAASAPATMTFDRDAGKYQLDAVAGNAFTVELDEMPYGVTFESVDFGGTTVAAFNAYGMPVNAGSVTLVNARRSIKIQLFTSGEVKR